MAETTYPQRYASADNVTAGSFVFDTISGRGDVAVSKVAFGAVNSLTYVDASNPLPVSVSGVATAANQATGNAHLATLAGAVSGTEMQVDVLTMPTVTIQDGGGAITVDGSVSITGSVAITAAALPLPSGAATAAKQPALGTAGTASSDVVTVQGIAGMTALRVDGSAVTQPVSGTFWQATQPVSIASSVSVTQSGTWTVGISGGQTLATVTTVSTVTNLAQMGGVAIAMGSGVRSAGTQRVTIATDDIVPASQSGTWTVQPGNTANTTAWLVSSRPATSGGLTMHKTISAASTNATSVKNSAGQLYDIEVYNLNASPRYLKLYNKASAPAVGTDVPVRTILIPGNTAGGGVTRTIPDGLAFSLGIAFALTTGIADSDTGAVALNEIAVNLGYA